LTSHDSQEFLQSLYELSKLLNIKTEKYTKLRDAAKNVSSIPENIPVQTSACKDSLENTICQMLDLEKELTCITNSILETIMVFDMVTSMLPDFRSKYVLVKRYRCALKWTAVASELSCSVRTAKVLHSKALIEFEAEFNKYITNMK